MAVSRFILSRKGSLMLAVYNLEGEFLRFDTTYNEWEVAQDTAAFLPIIPFIPEQTEPIGAQFISLSTLRQMRYDSVGYVFAVSHELTLPPVIHRPTLRVRHAPVGASSHPDSVWSADRITRLRARRHDEIKQLAKVQSERIREIQVKRGLPILTDANDAVSARIVEVCERENRKRKIELEAGVVWEKLLKMGKRDVAAVPLETTLKRVAFILRRMRISVKKGEGADRENRAQVREGKSSRQRKFFPLTGVDKPVETPVFASVRFKEPLTLRQAKVVVLLRKGFSPSSIAERLGVSRATVTQYIETLRMKLARE